MSKFNFDVAIFDKKMAELEKVRTQEPDSISSLFVMSEELSQDVYAKSSAFFIWVFGYDIPNCVLVYSFEKNVLFLFTDNQKYSYLEEVLPPTHSSKIKVELLKSFQDFLEEERFGTLKNAFFLKNKKGDLSEKIFSLCHSRFLLKEASGVLGDLLATKLAFEQENVKNAATLCNAIYKHFLVPEIETVIDEDIKVTHKALSDSTEKIISAPQKVKIDLNPDFLESCYSPLIQSGGEYNLKLSAEPSKKLLNCAKSAPIVISFGVMYKSYCCNLSRTLLFNPTEEQKRLYSSALEAFHKAKAALVPGAEFKEVWEAAFSVVQRTNPERLPNFLKNCGFCIGLQFREAGFGLNKANKKKVKAGMVFNLRVGFEDLVDAVKETAYAVQIADTVVVRCGKTESLTNAPLKLKNISYIIEKLQAESPGLGTNSDPLGVEADSGITPRKRKASRAFSINEDEKMKEKRLKLLEEKIQSALKQNVASAPKKKEELQRLRAYDSPSAMPSVTCPLKVFVDSGANCVLLPFVGVLCPVHVQNIKSLQVQREESVSLLQICFNNLFAAKATNDYVLREVILRSKNSKNFENVIRSVKEMKKNLAKLKNKDAGADVPDGRVVALIKDRTKIPRINKLKVRPVFAGKRGSVGTLEAHKNGFVFTLGLSKIKPVKINIFYENIGNAFFQPASNTASVLLHFHLKKALQLSKKIKDIQFYIDVVENSQNIERNIRSDQDALREEQKEVQFKKRLNKLFKDFVKASSRTATQNGFPLKFDVPSQELKFIGVPDRSTVSVYPTVDCLVSIEEYPPFVLPLKEIEIAHFERVQFQLKQFDLVFVLKDMQSYKRIDAIPIQYLSQLRRYLNDANVIYFTGSVNLDWDKILKEISSDTKGFWQNGGWSFLETESRKEAEESSGDTSEEGESFAPSSGDGSYSSSLSGDEDAG